MTEKFHTDDFEELAAKFEFDAGMTREEADKAAEKILSGKFYMRDDGLVMPVWSRAFSKK